jgi:membrane protein
LTLHAMGLVYVTILSLVPLLAVSFSVLKAFGIHREMQPLLLQFLSPLGEPATELAERIVALVDNAQGNDLAGLGLLFLFLTAVSMAEQVESSFNQIWRVGRPRSFGRRVSEYLSVILVGPVVMVTAMTLLATVRSSAFAGLEPLSRLGFTSLATALLPYLLVCVAFSFVYWFVPNTTVRATAALTGGVVGGVLWAATGAAFAAFVVNSATTINIYATFAIAITALLWLFLCWLILLAGAQVAFYVQNGDYLRIGYRTPVTGTVHQESTALAVMLLATAAFREGRGSIGMADLSRTTGLPGLALTPVIVRLAGAGLLVWTADERLLPGRDPQRVMLREVLRAVRHPQETDIRRQPRWPAAVLELTRTLESRLEETVGNETLAQLLERSETSRASAGQP